MELRAVYACLVAFAIAAVLTALVAALLFSPESSRTDAILAGAALITLVGAIDDARDLPPGIKLLGQIAAALVLVLSDVTVNSFTLPFVHRVELGDMGGPITL